MYKAVLTRAALCFYLLKNALFESNLASSPIVLVLRTIGAYPPHAMC